jgi:glucokinase
VSGHGALSSIPFPILIGDIGGTNARFALIADATAKVERLPNVHTADYATIDDAIEASLKGRARPKAAVLALAGPIAGDAVQLTNCPWVVKPKVSVARFDLAEMILLNDFEALSLSLPGLGDTDIDRIGGGTIRPDSTRVVLGPGTGLGAASLVHARGVWVPVPGEGGHVELGPVTERDMALWPHLERVQGRVSAEAVLCGAGMVRLYRAICIADGVTPGLSDPEGITAAGLAGKEARAAETLRLFATYLGRVAGNLALIFMPYGGVYLGGGISGRIAPVLKSGVFRDAFVAKAPHVALLERMATAIIIKEDAALAGIADFARAPARFGIELGGRRWRK